MNKTFSGILAAGALLAVVPWLGLPAFYESFLYLIAHWVILAMSWNILSGYSGYFSFGHGVFYGVGMYATAGLAGKLDWPFLATLPMAVLIPAVLGVLLGAGRHLRGGHHHHQHPHRWRPWRLPDGR
jgi:branched-chain amino acid transport system permease protein